MKAKKQLGIIISIAVIAIIVVCIIVLILSMRGETKTTGQNPDDVTSESLVCKSTTIGYPIFSYDNSKSKELTITANFRNNKVNALSLAHALYYDDADKIKASESFNHGDMNISFSNNGFSADYLNAHYSKMNDSMVMNLYATSSDITPQTAKYFMINMENKTSVPSSISEIRKNYTEQGFNCKINN